MFSWPGTASVPRALGPSASTPAFQSRVLPVFQQSAPIPAHISLPTFLRGKVIAGFFLRGGGVGGVVKDSYKEAKKWENS